MLFLAACVTTSVDDGEVAGSGAPGVAGAPIAGSPSAVAGGNSAFSAGAGGLSGVSVENGGALSSSAGVGTGGTTAAAVELCSYPAWVAMKPYVTGDKVTYLGKGYVATSDNPGYDPTISTFFWSALSCQPLPAAGGSTGAGGSSTGVGGSPTGGGGMPSTTPCARLDKLLPAGSSTFDSMFQPPWDGHVAKPLYAYSALCNAIASVPAFGAFANSGDLDKDKRELAAFFAHVAKETAFLEQSDEGKQASSSADFHGRGAIQITGYANYAAAGAYLHKDLTGNPGLVSTDALTNWQTALWYWMVNFNAGTSGIQNCHQAILAGDFGQTTRIINGGIECPSSQSARDRAQYYMNDCSKIMVSPGSNLVC